MNESYEGKRLKQETKCFVHMWAWDFEWGLQRKVKTNSCYAWPRLSIQNTFDHRSIPTLYAFPRVAEHLGIGSRRWAKFQVQVILFEIDCAIFYTNLHEFFCQFRSWTNWVNSGKFMDNCWISCQVMADMKM